MLKGIQHAANWELLLSDRPIVPLALYLNHHPNCIAYFDHSRPSHDACIRKIRIGPRQHDVALPHNCRWDLVDLVVCITDEDARSNEQLIISARPQARILGAGNLHEPREEDGVDWRVVVYAHFLCVCESI